MEKKKQYWVVVAALGVICSCGILLASCAGQRQGIVCDEIEYRNNSMAYSPDQRVFMEEELRACREEEARKKGSSGQKSIYERYASQESSKKVHVAGDSMPSQDSPDISVSTLLQDSSGKETTSIYDRYGAQSPHADLDSANGSDSVPEERSIESDGDKTEVPQE